MRQAAGEGKIPEWALRKVSDRFPLVTEGIERVQKASGLKYPYYYVEPSMVVSTSAAEYTQMGIFFARTIPVVGDDRHLRVVVQLTAPLIAYGLKGTIHAILAHEFMHYLELVGRIVKMNIISDEVVGTLFEGTYSDYGRLVDEGVVFRPDRTLIDHITKRFPEGFRDFRLEDKAIKMWMEKGLPITNVPIDANTVKIPVEVMATLNVDQEVRDRLTQYEEAAAKRRGKKDPGHKYA